MELTASQKQNFDQDSFLFSCTMVVPLFRRSSAGSWWRGNRKRHISSPVRVLMICSNTACPKSN